MIEVKNISKKFKKNIETSERGYFEIDKLPELSEIRNTQKQVQICFEAYKSSTWETVFD